MSFYIFSSSYDYYFLSTSNKTRAHLFVFIFSKLKYIYIYIEFSKMFKVNKAQFSIFYNNELTNTKIRQSFHSKLFMK